MGLTSELRLARFFRRALDLTLANPDEMPRESDSRPRG
jgi:hypothetical protein